MAPISWAMSPHSGFPPFPAQWTTAFTVTHGLGLTLGPRLLVVTSACGWMAMAPRQAPRRGGRLALHPGDAPYRTGLLPSLTAWHGRLRGMGLPQGHSL